MEDFFLQKRLLLSIQKPEQIILDDINDLKAEITRKDQVLQKYYEKLNYWQGILSETVASGLPGPRQVPLMTAQVIGGPLPRAGHTLAMAQNQIAHMIGSAMQ